MRRNTNTARRAAAVLAGTALAAGAAFLWAVEPTAAGRPSVVVTTSMLESAVAELGPAAGDVEVVRLLPPGSCPGQFDLSPRELPALRAATVVIRHAYQGELESKLRALGVDDARVVVADSEGSLLEPAHFADLAARMAEVMAQATGRDPAAMAGAVAVVRERMGVLEEEIRRRPSPWRGARVIAADQQAEFSRWLGLEVVGVLGRAEDTSPRELENLLQLRPALVVANLQEGAQAAASLARRLGVPAAVLSNFPGADGYGASYEELVRSDLEHLDAAWAGR